MTQDELWIARWQDAVDDFDFERDMARLADLPRQAEWEAFVAKA